MNRLIFLLAFAFCVSCTTSKSFQQKDFYGKTFVLQGDSTPAQYGGQQTMTFEQNNQVQYKIGDIMNSAEYNISGNNIMFQNTMTGTFYNYEIVNANTLKNGTQTWVAK